MAKFEDLKGQKFGYWTVVERAENHPATRRAQWFCECECGTKKIIRASALKSGKANRVVAIRMTITKSMEEKELVCMSAGVI